MLSSTCCRYCTMSKVYKMMTAQLIGNLLFVSHTSLLSVSSGIVIAIANCYTALQCKPEMRIAGIKSCVLIHAANDTHYQS